MYSLALVLFAAAIGAMATPGSGSLLENRQSLPANLCPGGNGLYYSTGGGEFYQIHCDMDVNFGDNAFVQSSSSTEECADLCSLAVDNGQTCDGATWDGVNCYGKTSPLNLYARTGYVVLVRSMCYDYKQ